MLFLETPRMWCQGNPASVSPCFGSSGESWGQGSNEGRTLHPEALSIYPYFQSSWPNRTVYQVGFDREVSFSDPIIPMPCVRSQVICCPHLNSRSVLNEFFEPLPATKRNCSFTFHIMFGHFFLWDRFMKTFSTCFLGLVGPRLVQYQQIFQAFAFVHFKKYI